VLKFIRTFPDFTEADCDVESVEDGKRHRDVGDDSPGPHAVVVQQCRVGIGPTCLKSTDSPHC